MLKRKSKEQKLMKIPQDMNFQGMYGQKKKQNKTYKIRSTRSSKKDKSNYKPNQNFKMKIKARQTKINKNNKKKVNKNKRKLIILYKTIQPTKTFSKTSQKTVIASINSSKCMKIRPN